MNDIFSFKMQLHRDTGNTTCIVFQSSIQPPSLQLTLNSILQKTKL